MKDEKEMVRCDECGSQLVKDFIRDETYCVGCGLVYDPNHKMGRGLIGLIDYMEHYGFKEQIETIRVINSMQGLTQARIAVSKL